MPLDLLADVVLRWDHQDPAVAPLLKECGANAVLALEPQAAFRQALNYPFPALEDLYNDRRLY
jgi:hypothetical protein